MCYNGKNARTEERVKMYEFKEVVKDIFVMKAPFSIVWTGVTLVRGKKNFLIDSGADLPDVYVIPALKKLGVDIKDIDYLLNTHCHGDHITGHFDIVSKYGLKVATYAGGVGALADPASNAVRIRTRFPEHSPAPQSWLKGVDPDVILQDGDILEGRLKLIATPGHDTDCVCWYDIPTKTLVTGDSLQGGGTPTQGIGFYQSLDAYEQSLKKLTALDAENIILGHEYDGLGDFIVGKEKVKRALAFCSELTKKYETLIASYVKEGMTDDAEIAVRLINEVGCGMPEKLFLPLYTVTEHRKRLGI